MPTLAELLGMAPSSDAAMPYLWPSSKRLPNDWSAPVTADTWPSPPSISAFIPNADDALTPAFRGLLGDHPVVQEVSAPPAGGILGGVLPAPRSNQAPDAASVGQGLLGLGDTWPASAIPVAGPDYSRVLPYPNSVPSVSDSGGSGYLAGVFKRTKDNFREAYAEPLGPGPEYRALMAPLMPHRASWDPRGPAENGLLLGLPTLMDALLRLPRPLYDSLIDALVVEHGVSIGLDPGSMERWGENLRECRRHLPGRPGCCGRCCEPPRHRCFARRRRTSI